MSTRSKKTSPVIHPIKPIKDQYSRVLILGSFPSVISRKHEMYYANPSNRFWPVLSYVFNEEITDREDFCHRHHIALWDVIESCTIHGSSDSSISDVKVNDIAGLIKDTNIRVIFTTGQKACKLYKNYIDLELPMIGLPSTSGANARMRFEDLVHSYQVIKTYAEEN